MSAVLSARRLAAVCAVRVESWQLATQCHGAPHAGSVAPLAKVAYWLAGSGGTAGRRQAKLALPDNCDCQLAAETNSRSHYPSKIEKWIQSFPRKQLHFVQVRRMVGAACRQEAVSC